MKELLERLAARENLDEAAVMSKEIMDAGFDYLKKKKVGKFLGGMVDHIKKETGKSIGFKHVREIMGEFMKVG